METADQRRIEAWRVFREFESFKNASKDKRTINTSSSSHTFSLFYCLTLVVSHGKTLWSLETERVRRYTTQPKEDWDFLHVWPAEEHGWQIFIRKWLLFFIFLFPSTPHIRGWNRSYGSSFHLGGGRRRVQARAHKTRPGLLRHQPRLHTRLGPSPVVTHNEPLLWGW